MKKGSFLNFLLIVCLFVVKMPWVVFAGGSQDATEKSIESPAGFKEKLDINDKKPGKYNFYLEAQDKGGNITLEGPHNIYIDPESDLPVVRIINPRQEMRVPGNLNIVGTCIDDDGVAAVELMFNEDPTTIVKAEGTEFWSYYLDSKNLPDNLYSITAWGVDINGLKGKPVKVSWNLDRKRPVTEVESHSLGALVSGTITLRGWVEDGNGIETLSVSVDNGKTFQPVKISQNKKEKRTTFTTAVNTRQFEDGPKVIWFKAKDRQGTSGIYSYLMYVDNTKPDVKVVYPEPDKAVNGIFTVAGYAKDTVGLKSLSWSLGKDTGEFELIVGNPWWVKTFDIRGQNVKSLDLVITAVDVSGNVTTEKRKIIVDQTADLPVVQLEEPQLNQVFFGHEINLRGIARDDDGVEQILYSLDGAAPIEIPTTGAFQLVISDIKAGPHTIEVWSKDITGIIGPKVVVKNIVVAGNVPDLVIDQVVSGAAKGGEQKPFRSGIEVNSESNPRLVIKVSSESALKKLSWTLGSLPEQNVEIKGKSSNPLTYEIPIPLTIDYGQVLIRITATDIYDRQGVLENYIYVTDLTRPRGEPAVVFDDLRIAEDGTLRLDDVSPFTGYLVGANAKRARLTKASKVVRLVVEGNYFRLEKGESPGREENLVVEFETDKGFTYRSRPFTVINPGKTPVLTLDDPLPRFINTEESEGLSTMLIGGKVQADLPVDRVIWKLYGASSSTALKEGELPVTKDQFELKLEKEDIPFGPMVIEFSARTDGEWGVVALPVYREDPQALPLDPKAKIPTPVLSWVEGVQLYYLVNSAIPLDAYDLQINGKVPGGEVPQNLPYCGVVPRSALLVGTNTLNLRVIQKLEKREQSWNFSYKATRVAPPSSIQFDQVDGQNWYNGIVVSLPRGGKKGAALIAKVKTYSQITNATAAFGEKTGLRGSIKKLSDSEYEVSFELPADLPAERIPVAVEVAIKDSPAVKASGSFFVVRPVEGRQINVAESFRWVAPTVLSDATILLDQQKPLLGIYTGRPLAKVDFAKKTEGLRCEVADGLVVLSSLRDGLYKDVRLVLTDVDGWQYTSEAYTILADSQKPELVFVKNIEGAWIQNSLAIEITATDVNGIQKLEYSVDLGKTWQPLPDKKTTLDVSSLPDGIVGVVFQATDTAGRVSRIGATVHKDTVAPVAKVMVPIQDARINGIQRMGIAIEDGGRIASVEYEGPDKKRTPLEPGYFMDLVVGTPELPLKEGMKFHIIDAAGNKTVLDAFPFVIDQQMDLPIAVVNVPEDNEVITTDFVVSGIIYDDDKPARIWYKIDEGALTALEAEYAFSIPIPLTSLTDNEHTITIIPEDMYGVKGNPVVRRFRVSLEEPNASVVSPRFDETVKGVVEIKGVASDKNGIALVQVSLDNGVSFNDAKGTEQWSYKFDSKILQDATHVVFIRVRDNYGIEGLYSSMISVDNTPPRLSLESPIDGLTTVGPVSISGQASDSMALAGITVNLRSLEGVKIPPELATITIKPDAVITADLDLASLPDGLYNIDVWAIDEAENVTRLSRNIKLAKNSQPYFIECLYPLEGEYVQGSFNLYGYVGGTEKVKTLSLLVNGEVLDVTEVTAAGYFRFSLDGTKLPSGPVVLKVRGDFGGTKMVESTPRTIHYTPSGPWVTVDSLTMGDFAFERPWLSGRAGYDLSEEEKTLLADKKLDKEIRDAILAKKLQGVDISFDNGRTFKEIAKNGKWRFRLETQDMAEGTHYMVLRARMANGETAVTRMLVQIDKTPPTIRLISPQAGGRYNQELEFAGLSGDDIELKDLQYVLRKGDKASYEIPGFIQGLYLDTHFWGSTLFDVGAGLTFFDNNVKLQFQVGQFTQEQWSWFTSEPMRYGGMVYGAKLLANIFYFPFSFIGGPDWSWLSASVALGANYSYFTYTQSGKPQMLSAILGQFEFPRITIQNKNMKMFRSFAMYTELQLWFVPTDVDTSIVDVDTLVPHITAGFRLNVF